MATKLRIALIQLSVTSNKAANLRHARDLISKAATAAKSYCNVGQEWSTPLVVLPECFNSPYGKRFVLKYIIFFEACCTEN